MPASALAAGTKTFSAVLRSSRPTKSQKAPAYGGLRPAVNAQFAADVASQVVVGVDVSNSGRDYGKLVPMLGQVQARYGRTPEDVLVDGGFASLSDSEEASAEPHGCTVDAPPMTPRGQRRRSESPRRESEAISRWRVRMETPKAKEIYEQRASTAECVNAQARNRGLLRLLVRGLEKARAVLLLHALAHDLMPPRRWGPTDDQP